MPPGGIRTRSPSKRAAAEPLLSRPATGISQRNSQPLILPPSTGCGQNSLPIVTILWNRVQRWAFVLVTLNLRGLLPEHLLALLVSNIDTCNYETL